MPLILNLAMKSCSGLWFPCESSMPLTSYSSITGKIEQELRFQQQTNQQCNTKQTAVTTQFQSLFDFVKQAMFSSSHTDVLVYDCSH